MQRTRLRGQPWTTAWVYDEVLSWHQRLTTGRITFPARDPVSQGCMAFRFNVVPCSHAPLPQSYLMNQSNTPQTDNSKVGVPLQLTRHFSNTISEGVHEFEHPEGQRVCLVAALRLRVHPDHILRPRPPGELQGACTAPATRPQSCACASGSPPLTAGWTRRPPPPGSQSACHVLPCNGGPGPADPL